MDKLYKVGDLAMWREFKVKVIARGLCDGEMWYEITAVDFEAPFPVEVTGDRLTPIE